MPDGTPQSIGLLKDKVAVITGAGSGIGKAMVQVFVREGAKVLAADISGRQEDVAADFPGSVEPFQVDVTREEQVEAMFASAIARFGRIDALVNVAGVPGGRRGAEVSAEEFDQIADVHFKGALLCCKHGVRAMIDNGGGAIVNLSSAASFNADGRISIAYSASKSAVNSFTKAFAVQYGRQGVRVNAIAPGFTLSEINLKAPPEVLRELRSKGALGRAADPREQAEVAAFLVSDRASFVTGAIIPVDGGWTARLA